ncbi:MAG TPA: hypothetical protein VLK84_25505 [Longimicrobium sp.]|nr:hypothetical protein [Longimicrobium sp.]
MDGRRTWPLAYRVREARFRGAIHGLDTLPRMPFTPPLGMALRKADGAP